MFKNLMLLIFKLFPILAKGQLYETSNCSKFKFCHNVNFYKCLKNFQTDRHICFDWSPYMG